MSNYELTYILRPLDEAGLATTNDRISTVVLNAGGEILARNDWGRRRLAYPIRKTNDGYYTTLYLTLPGTAVRGVSDERITAAVQKVFSFKPADIVAQLGLLRPIYRQTTNYGHFGKTGLPWEQTNKAAALRAAVK